MYSWSPYLSQISLKNSFGKVVFQILAEIEMTRNENRLFGRHFETVQIFYIFFPEMVVISVFIWSKNSGGKVVFSFPWNPPLCTGYLMQLSVNVSNTFLVMSRHDWTSKHTRSCETIIQKLSVTSILTYLQWLCVTFIEIIITSVWKTMWK